MEKIREYTPVSQSFIDKLSLDSKNEDDFGVDATYKDIEYTVKQLATEDDDPSIPRTHFILCGDPGIGKTTIVERALHECIPQEEYESRVVKFSGKVGRGVDNVATILRENASGKILLFDDCDDWLKSESIANILKAAMLESKVTIIGQNYNSKKKLGENWDSADFFKQYTQDEDDSAQAVVDEPKVHVPTPASDTNSKFDSTFKFTSRFIFISNMNKTDIESAIVTRAVVIELKLNTSQVIDLLEDRVADTIPVRWPSGIQEKGKDVDFCKQVRDRVLSLLKVFDSYTNDNSNMAVSAVIGPIKERDFKQKINFRTYKDAVGLWANKYLQIRQTESDKRKVASRCDNIVLTSFVNAVS